MSTVNLPTEAQRERLCALVAEVLVHIRSLARESGNETIEALADTFHNLPREMHGWGRWDPELTYGLIAECSAKYAVPGLAEAFRECMRPELPQRS